AGGLRRARLPAVRLLHAGHDPHRMRAPHAGPEALAGGDRPRDGGEPLPLRRAPEDPRRDRGGVRHRLPAPGLRGAEEGGPALSERPTLDRRRFFQLTGGGIAVFVGLGPKALFAQEPRSYPEDLNAYLLIGKDGRVTVFSGKIEMGQGVMTSQAQMVAEELG